MPEAADRLEALLAGFGPQLGEDARGYGNHVRRVFRLVALQGSLSPDELHQVAVAAVFHDLAIWLDDTFDYLDPSADHAEAYLRADGREAWIPLVRRMILEHHKLRPVRDAPLVEALRRADLADVTLGRLHRGIPAGAWADLRAELPIHGFHWRLIQLAARQTRRDPLRPLPMMRW